MKSSSKISLSFLEKFLMCISPIIFGMVGYFLPKCLIFIKKIPVISDSKIVVLLDSFNPFLVSLILMIIGIIVGSFFSLIIFSECLKLTVDTHEIKIDKDDYSKIIKFEEVQKVFMQDKEIIIEATNGEILLSEQTDISKAKVKDAFKQHYFPWYDINPYTKNYIHWKLNHSSLNNQVNSILYERRIALRDNNSKKAKSLKKDLNELGIIVKDKNNEQYVCIVE